MDIEKLNQNLMSFYGLIDTIKEIILTSTDLDLFEIYYKCQIHMSSLSDDYNISRIDYTQNRDGRVLKEFFVVKYGKTKFEYTYHPSVETFKIIFENYNLDLDCNLDVRRSSNQKHLPKNIFSWTLEDYLMMEMLS